MTHGHCAAVAGSSASLHASFSFECRTLELGEVLLVEYINLAISASRYFANIVPLSCLVPGMAYKRPLPARHEPVMSGPHFDEGFGRLRMSRLVRVKPYRKDPKPSADDLFRMS